MGCTVEARFRAGGSLVVREQRVFHGDALAAESLMAFDPRGNTFMAPLARR